LEAQIFLLVGCGATDGSMERGKEARTKVQGLFDVLVKRIQELEADLDETQATILQLETTIVVLTRQLHVKKDLLDNSDPFVALPSPPPRLEDHLEKKTPKLSDSTKTGVRTLNASLEEICKRSEEETTVWQREKKEMQTVHRLQEEVLAAANANVRTLNASLEEIRKRSEEETTVWQREKKEMQKVNRLQEEVLAAANANASLEEMHARPDEASGPKVDSLWLTTHDAMTVVQLGRRKGTRTRDRLPWGW
jgi:Ulp1 family protease